MDRRQRRNPSASSSAFSSPASSSSRFRSEKFSSNPPKTSNSLEDAHQLKSKCGKPQRPEQEEEGEQDPNNLLSLVGTCPFMCPGKNACLFFHFFLNSIFLLFCVWFPRNWRKTAEKRSESGISVSFLLLLHKFYK